MKKQCPDVHGQVKTLSSEPPVSGPRSRNKKKRTFASFFVLLSSVSLPFKASESSYDGRVHTGTLLGQDALADEASMSREQREHLAVLFCFSADRPFESRLHVLIHRADALPAICLGTHLVNKTTTGCMS